MLLLCINVTVMYESIVCTLFLSFPFFSSKSAQRQCDAVFCAIQESLYNCSTPGKNSGGAQHPLQNFGYVILYQ